MNCFGYFPQFECISWGCGGLAVISCIYELKDFFIAGRMFTVS